MSEHKTKWRVGWSPDGRRFYFRSPNGYRETLSGRKEAIRDHVRRSLPIYLDVARKNHADVPEFIAAIEREIAALGVTP